MTHDAEVEATPQMKRAAAARYRADVARHDLVRTVKEIGFRLRPGQVAKRAAVGAKESAVKGYTLARKEAQERPVAVGFATVAAGLFLALRVRHNEEKGNLDGK